MFFSVLVYFSQAQLISDYVFSWRSVFLWQAIVYGWAILFPAISWFAVRFRIERGNWRQRLPVYIIAAVLFVLAHTFLYAVYYHLCQCFYAGEDCNFLESFRRFVFSNWLLDSSVYFLILCLVTARDYSRRFQAEQLKSSQLNAALADSQLSALKMQLHPHFLFNTLNSISTLMHEDVRAADEMVARLGYFLRLTLENSGEQVVTLAQEMNFINSYLEIESVRFGERLKLEKEIAPDVLRAQVPNLILQPLIENAIKHGVSQQIRPGKIIIRARRENAKLQLEVEDDGPGLQNGNGNGGTGIGLKNTRARLRTLYGDAQRVEIKNAVPQGVVVTLELPYEINHQVNLNVIEQ